MNTTPYIYSGGGATLVPVTVKLLQRELEKGGSAVNVFSVKF